MQNIAYLIIILSMFSIGYNVGRIVRLRKEIKKREARERVDKDVKLLEEMISKSSVAITAFLSAGNPPPPREIELNIKPTFGDQDNVIDITKKLKNKNDDS